MVQERERFFSQAGGVHSFVHGGKFRICKAYQFLKPEANSVSWKRIICNSRASPKSTFIVWLAIQNRLATKDRLMSWNLNVDGQRVLCQKYPETVTHLFFECEYSAAIWDKVMQSCGGQRSIQNWPELIEWVAKKSRSTKSPDTYRSVLFIESVYAIWIQRNSKLFKNKLDSCSNVVNRVLFRTACRQDR
ncbi:uncharacterized protein [Spinacia oleracea]|uniref:Reverse transcriptase zinc-binding domain-containing protein n=1 Tax=Spinacia oleracea TaxID=3562 RepID=A0A9R0KDI4_SPIOL|nr:uncharacterized protein LOC110805459 [Spinacia oleracea]